MAMIRDVRSAILRIDPAAAFSPRWRSVFLLMIREARGHNRFIGHARTRGPSIPTPATLKSLAEKVGNTMGSKRIANL